MIDQLISHDTRLFLHLLGRHGCLAPLSAGQVARLEQELLLAVRQLYGHAWEAFKEDAAEACLALLAEERASWRKSLAGQVAWPQ